MLRFRAVPRLLFEGPLQAIQVLPPRLQICSFHTTATQPWHASDMQAIVQSPFILRAHTAASETPLKGSLSSPRMTTARKIAATKNASNAGSATKTRKLKAALSPVDLNEKLNQESISDSKHSVVPARSQAACFDKVETVTALFEGISAKLCDFIDQTPYIVGCMAWLSDPSILKSLGTRQGVSIVVTNDAMLSLRTLVEAYSAIPSLEKNDNAIRCLGNRTGQFRALMHHKFLVGLDASRNAVWAVTGSFNASSQASRNIENALFIEDHRVASLYFDEYTRIHGVSKVIPRRRK